MNGVLAVTNISWVVDLHPNNFSSSVVKRGTMSHHFDISNSQKTGIKILLIAIEHLQFIEHLLYIRRGFPDGSEVKASACNAGDPGSIPGLGRSPGEGNGNPLQNSCLENPMDREESGRLQSIGLHRVQHD